MKFINLLALSLFCLQGCHSEIQNEAKSNVACSASGATAVIVDKDGKQFPATAVIDGNVQDNSSIMATGVPFEIIIFLPSAERINSVRIFPGKLIYSDRPSEECGIKSYAIEGFINGGWIELASCKNASAFKNSKASSEETFFIQNDFQPKTISQLKLKVLESGDTGLRADALPGQVVRPELRTTYIREIEAYSDTVAQKAGSLESLINADFRLPVYRNSDYAELIIIGDEKANKDIPVKISFKERTSGNVPVEPVLFTVKPGCNTVKIDIGKWANGYYFSTVEAPAANGKLTRLLRIQNLPDTAIPSEPINTMNKKIFFFDDWYIKEKDGVSLKVFPAETTQATRPFISGPEFSYQRSWNMNFDETGKLVVKFFEEDRSPKNRKWHYACTSDLKNWKISQQAPAAKLIPIPRTDKTAVPEAIPKWQPKHRPETAVSYRFYDEKKDGKIPLNEILVKWSGVKDKTLGNIPIAIRSTYPVWEKSPGEMVLLTQKPLLIDKPEFGVDEFDDETCSNDNFGGQWLSPDGKTFLYCRGLVVRRFSPFNVKYDNLWQLNRLLAIFYTHDGLKWEQVFFTLPDNNDSWSYQHYGANIFRIPDSDFWLAYLFAYDAVKQQIYIELNYSHDSIIWKRFEGKPPFIKNGSPGAWDFGMIFVDGSPIEKNGKMYHLIGNCYSRVHFYPDNISGVTPKSLEKRFGSKGLEQWPYFVEVGKWKGLAESIKKAGQTIGVMSYRKDGWAGICSDETGEIITRKLLSGNSELFINAKTAPGGFVKIEILDNEGNKIPEYSGENAAIFTGNFIYAPVLWENGKLKKMPGKPFSLKITMKMAELYSLQFKNHN